MLPTHSTEIAPLEAALYKELHKHFDQFYAAEYADHASIRLNRLKRNAAESGTPVCPTEQQKMLDEAAENARLFTAGDAYSIRNHTLEGRTHSTVTRIITSVQSELNLPNDTELRATWPKAFQHVLEERFPHLLQPATHADRVKATRSHAREFSI